MLAQLAILLTALTVFFSAPTQTQSVVKKDVSAPEVPFELTATNVFLIDDVRGEILYQKKADMPYPLASITKLMTALTLIDSKVDWESKGMFDKNDRRNGDIPYLIPGDEIALKDALTVMLVASSNDAAAFLARVVFGDEVKAVAAMNKKAQELGLKRMNFVDVTGLNPQNTGTAREVAALARIALSYAEIGQAVRKSTFDFTPQGKPARKVYATDQLLNWFRAGNMEILGGKTGYIDESKYNLVFALGKQGSELIGVIFGSESNDLRFKEMAKLINWGIGEIGN